MKISQVLIPQVRSITLLLPERVLPTPTAKVVIFFETAKKKTRILSFECKGVPFGSICCTNFSMFGEDTDPTPTPPLHGRGVATPSCIVDKPNGTPPHGRGVAAPSCIVSKPNGTPLPSRGGAGVGSVLFYFTISKVQHLGQPTSNGDYSPVYYRLLVITLSLFGFHQVPIVGGLPLIFAPNRQK